jgi:hypothetical protein
LDESIGVNMPEQHAVTNKMNVDFQTMDALLMQGGYTSLLLGVDSYASAARELHFDASHNRTT